jgi:hypothetical protein
MMRAEIVHHEDIPRLHFRQQLPRELADETVRVRGRKHRPQDHPAGVPPQCSHRDAYTHPPSVEGKATRQRALQP